MPIGVRDFLLVIRAQDLASREIARVGTAIGGLHGTASSTGRNMMALGTGVAAMGAGMVAVGAAAAGALANFAKASIDYTQQASLTLTQVDERYNATLEQIKNVGRSVARDVPAPFKQLQDSLYDIFSSIDVDVKQSEILLRAFAKSAVAGNTDVQTAGRSTIAILNAFKIPAEDVNRVMDIQFETVRKGVITYEEYASTIGRSIPSAAKAGATIEELSAMIAFMTRNGLSAAMASTSAARAFDLMTNPKFAEKMRDMGISVTDAKGKFRPMSDVVADLRKGLAGMSDEARSNTLKELTKGAGGTIQAMRFLNMAVLDTNGLLPQLTEEIRTSSGAAGRAYEIMSNTPQAKIDLLKNRWEVLRTELGDRVMPIVGQLAAVGEKVIDWLLKLSPEVQDLIVKALMLTAVIGVLGGIFVVLVGGAMVLAGAFAAVGLPLWAIVAAVAAVGLALFSAWQWFQDTSAEGDKLRTKITDAFNTIKYIIRQVVADVREYLYNNKWDEKIKVFVEEAKATLTVLWGFISAGLEMVARFWDEHGQSVMMIVGGALDIIMGLFRALMALIRGDFDSFRSAMDQAWQGLSDAAWGIVRLMLSGIVELFAGAITGILNLMLKLPFIPEAIKKELQKSIDNVNGFKDDAIDAIDQINKKEIRPKEPDTAPAIASFRAMERDMGLTIDRINARYIRPVVAGSVATGANMRALAAGAIIRRPEIALIGEAGPEVVVPLNDMRRAGQLLNQSGLLDKLGHDGAFAGSFSGAAPNFAGSTPVASSTGGNISITVEAGAFQISGVSEPERVGDIVDEKIRNILSELRARN